MILSFFESAKYVGHLFPLTLLRFYMGYYYFVEGHQRMNSDYMTEPQLASMITEWLPTSSAPLWYKNILEKIIVPNWQLSAYCVVYFLMLLGVSLMFGFLVRPLCWLGAFIVLNFMIGHGPEQLDFFILHFVVLITLANLGAGRCLGVDYYFFKKDRGIWW